MYRGLIFGGLAFALAMLAERQLAAVGKAVERYDRIRAMSGDVPLRGQVLSMLRGSIGSFGGSIGGGPTGLINALQSDILRYARISTM